MAISSPAAPSENGAIIPIAEQELSRKDYASEVDTRWCPGCGDYSILAQTQRALSNLNVAPEKMVFVSGIGCSSRFRTTWRPTGCTRSTAARRPSPPGSSSADPTCSSS